MEENKNYPVTNYYRLFVKNNRSRLNSRYDLRNSTTKAICHRYVGNGSDIKRIKREPLDNDIAPIRAVQPVSTIRLLAHYAGYTDPSIYVNDLLDDIFSEELVPMILNDFDTILDGVINILIKEELKGENQCGNCKMMFNDWSFHILESSFCSKYNTKCNLCFKFFCGTKGLEKHLALMRKSRNKVNIRTHLNPTLSIFKPNNCKVLVTDIFSKIDIPHVIEGYISDRLDRYGDEDVSSEGVDLFDDSVDDENGSDDTNGDIRENADPGEDENGSGDENGNSNVDIDVEDENGDTSVDGDENHGQGENNGGVDGDGSHDGRDYVGGNDGGVDGV